MSAQANEQPSPAPTRCGCVQRMNDALRETYPGVQLLTALGIHKPTIAVVRLVGRGKTPVIFPTYCPFCGMKYGD